MGFHLRFIPQCFHGQIPQRGMQCAECGLRAGELVAVTYLDETTVNLHLCEECRESFGDGEFVKAVRPLDRTES